MISRATSGRLTIEHGENRFYTGEHLFTEPAFFDLFDFELREGDAATALASPNSVVLTKTTAARLFGDGDSMGQTLKAESYGDGTLTVTGVLRDPPRNSHLDYNMLISIATLETTRAGEPTSRRIGRPTGL